MECKWILLRKRPSCRFLHSLCKNENIPIAMTTWLEALLVNMNKLVLMFHGKFSCIKTINVIKKKIDKIRPLTAEIIKKIIKSRATASSGIRKMFRVVI